MGESHSSGNRTRALALTLTVTYLLIGGLFTYFYWADRTETYKFGYEYGNVAASVATGDGFGNVFGDDTGPTAWCPPAYVLVQTLVFAVFGVKSLASMWVILAIRVLLLGGALFLLLKIDYGQSLNKYRFLMLPVLAVLSGLILTKDFDDKALNVFLSVLTVFLVQQIAKNGFDRYRVAAYALAAILPLANVFLLGGSFLLIAWNGVRVLRSKEAYLSGKNCTALIALMIVSSTAWGIRNKIALGQYIPFKSNLWFEVYMSNVADPDGLMQRSNWISHHPITNPTVRESYASQGELKFLEPYNGEVLAYLKSNGDEFVRKALRRSVNAFVFMMSSDDLITADTINIGAQDLEILKAHQFLVWDYWMKLDMPEEDFRTSIEQMNLANSSVVLRDWKAKRDIVEARRFSSLSQTAAGFLYALVPTLAILTCLCFKRIRDLLIFRVNLYFLILSWAPYIILSHYARYQSFQIGMFTLMIFLCAAGVIERIEAIALNRKKKAETQKVSMPN